jgi:glycosyltransferase involved in cell wall biosynthesis
MSKLLVFTDTDSTQINGVKLSIDNLIANLDASMGLKIVSPDDFWHFPLPYYNEILLSMVLPKRIRKMLREYRPRYVHIATEGPIGFVAAKVCKELGIGYTSSFHTKFPEYIRLHSKIIPSSYVHSFLKYIHDGSDKVFISNDSIRKYLESNAYAHIHVIPFGIDHSVFFPGPKKFFQDLPGPVLLFVGRISIEKNVEDFLEIRTGGTKIVVGDGPQKEKFEKKYPEAKFLGFKNKEELAEIYRSADAFVLPSKTDTLGLVNLEAMACGLPVVAYDVDGPRGIVKPGKTGILVPESQKLETGIAGALVLDSRDCIESVTGYTWQSYAEKFIKFQTPIPDSQWI